MLTVSETWKTTYPGAAVGILAMRNVAKVVDQLTAKKS